MEPLLGPYPLSVTPSPNIALYYEWQKTLLGWPEYLPPRHVGLSWAHPERLQQGIWTCQRAPDSGFLSFFSEGESRNENNLVSSFPRWRVSCADLRRRGVLIEFPSPPPSSTPTPPPPWPTPAIARNTKVLAARTGASPPETKYCKTKLQLVPTPRPHPQL